MIATIEEFTNQALLFLGQYGFLIVILFGILHPLFENPLSLFTLTVSITLYGPISGVLLLFFANIIGILILLYGAKEFHVVTHAYLLKRKYSKKALDWISNTQPWKHIVVIGVPFIPTYPIKLALALSKQTYQRRFLTLLLAYVFLFFGNLLIYYGVLGLITSKVPMYVSYIVLVILIVYIYFGKSLYKTNKE